MLTKPQEIPTLYSNCSYGYICLLDANCELRMKFIGLPLVPKLVPRIEMNSRCYALLLLIGLMFAGCAPQRNVDSSSASGARSYPISIIATVGMVADIVREVGGNKVAVKQLMGAGVDPHLYKATRDDMVMLQSGDMIFYSGLMLEGKMGDTFVKISRSKPVIAVTEKIDESYLLEPDGAAGHADPHVWMDVAAWTRCIDVVVESLTDFDPMNGTMYRERAEAYRARLAKLHAYGKEVVASIPESGRVLITSHDAFNYLGRAYGLDVIGVQGISTESEAGLQQINELVDLLVQRRVGSVFIETSVSQKSIQALVEGAKARGHEVVIGGELFSDAMGEEGTYEGTYEGMLDHNFTIIARALGGTAPANGLNGKLR